MIFFAPVMFVLFWVMMIAQEFLAPWTVTTTFGVAEVYFFLPWVFFYSMALAIPYPLMVAFAALTGFTWDARWQVPGDSS